MEISDSRNTGAEESCDITKANDNVCGSSSSGVNEKASNSTVTDKDECVCDGSTISASEEAGDNNISGATEKLCDSSITGASEKVCDSSSTDPCVQFQPPASSTPQEKIVRRQLFKLLSARRPDLIQSKNACDSSLLSDAHDTSVASTSGMCSHKTVKHRSSQTDNRILLRPLEELQAPLTKGEEAYLTRLVRIKMEQSSDKQTVVCKTGGQPFILKKIIKARKSSAFASTPTRRKRMNQLANIRKETSGSSEADLIKQHSTELRFTRKRKQTEILKAAGCAKGHITAKQATKMKARMILSWARQRKFRKLSKQFGVTVDSEEKQREFQKDLMCGEIQVDYRKLVFHDQKSDKDIVKTTPVVFVEDLPTFIANVLDQYEEKNMLTWHKHTIPENEVWIKIGGDHGGGSFKLVLSVVNVDRPNAKENCFLVGIVETKDSSNNIRTILNPLSDQISQIQSTKWKGKKIRLFLFGDYDFLVKMYGLSGAQAVHPCLWCEVSKSEIQVKSTEQTRAQKRTLGNIKKNHAEFLKAGGQKTDAKFFKNVILPNVWDIELNHVVPPYLHILLGIVKKHHDLLEDECYDLDKRIALAMAKEENPNFRGLSEGFKKSVKQVKHECHVQQTKNPSLKGLRPFGKCDGPVVNKIDKVLQKHKIARQAYYSGAFVGNHCNKYLKHWVINDILDSLERKVYELTDNHEIHTVATEIKDRYWKLNTFFSKVHAHLSSKKPLQRDEVHEVQEAIARYMDVYRGYFITTNVFPKQHILEDHCVQWIKKWRCGLALHGEQGGEEMHATVNQLKRRAWGLRKQSKRLRLIMKEQWVLASPKLQDTPQKKENVKEI